MEGNCRVEVQVIGIQGGGGAESVMEVVTVGVEATKCHVGIGDWWLG